MLEKQETLFLNKKVMYFIPHEDDEINMGGGFIYWVAKFAAAVKVVYAMNGDYRTSASKRMREAIHSLKLLGIDKRNVVFLGYPDKTVSGSSVYTYEINDRGTEHHETYIPIDINSEMFENGFKPQEATRENLTNDIYNQIYAFRPDVLFCVDFDSHFDHRVLSICFERAIGKIIKAIRDYQPIVYKQFAYPTNYKGPKDFYGKELPETRFSMEDSSDYDLQNPFYKWDQRVRFAIPVELRTRDLRRNIAYSALKQHKSQSIVSRSDRIINNDSIAWQRRTDNLLLDQCCTIETSSGNGNYLNDFMLFDCTDIIDGNAKPQYFDSGVWVPDEEDDSPEIHIHFGDAKRIRRIVLYRSCNTEEQINEIKIDFGNNCITSFTNETMENVWTIDLNLDPPISDIGIQVKKGVTKSAGFSEIEVFEERESSVIVEYGLYNDNLVYGQDNTSVNGIYQYDGYVGTYIKTGGTSSNRNSFLVDYNNIHNYLLLKCLRIKYGFFRTVKRLLNKY